MKVQQQHGGSDTDNESTAGDRLILEARQDFRRALALGAASVVFTLVAGMAADTILSGFAFHNMEVLALFQQASLSLMGAVSEWLCHHGSSSSSNSSSSSSSGHSGASHSKPVNTHEHDGGPISPSSSSSPLARSVPWKWRIVLGICLTGNVYFTNLASLLLTYPVQVVFKSSKLLITMVVRRYVFHKHNATIDYVSATLLTVGLVGFLVPSPAAASDAVTEAATAGGSASDAAVVATSWVAGLAAVGVALASETGMYMVEENVLFARYNVSHGFIMKQGYFYGAVLHVVGVVLTGRAAVMMEGFRELTPQIAALLLFFPCVLGIGVTFQLLLIKSHGSVVATACQVLRKIVSVIVSTIMFSRSMSAPKIVGCVFVFGSMVVKAVHKAMESRSMLPHVYSPTQAAIPQFEDDSCDDDDTRPLVRNDGSATPDDDALY